MVELYRPTWREMACSVFRLSFWKVTKLHQACFQCKFVIHPVYKDHLCMKIIFHWSLTGLYGLCLQVSLWTVKRDLTWSAVSKDTTTCLSLSEICLTIPGLCCCGSTCIVGLKQSWKTACSCVYKSWYKKHFCVLYVRHVCWSRENGHLFPCSAVTSQSPEL